MTKKKRGCGATKAMMAFALWKRGIPVMPSASLGKMASYCEAHSISDQQALDDWSTLRVGKRKAGPGAGHSQLPKDVPKMVLIVALWKLGVQASDRDTLRDLWSWLECCPGDVQTAIGDAEEYLQGQGEQGENRGTVGTGAQGQDDLLQTPPKSHVLKQMALGKSLLDASPSASVEQAVVYQNPLLVMFQDGTLPLHNKMVRPPDFIGKRTRNPQYYAAAHAMGYAVNQGRKYWASLASSTTSGTELKERPSLLACMGGVFLCIPTLKQEDCRASEQVVDSQQVKVVDMAIRDGVDMLVFEGDRVVKKTLSPQFAHETGSEPVGKRRKLTEKPPIVRFKQDIIVSSRNASGKWTPRLSIEHKGNGSHETDIWEALSSSCRVMSKSFKENLDPRLYIFLWGSEDLKYQILDVFGEVEVIDGIVTETAYAQFVAHFKASVHYMGLAFPHDSVRQWILKVDSLLHQDQGMPSTWNDGSEECPITLARLQWLFQHKQKTFTSLYGGDLYSQKYLVGISYREPLKRRALTSPLISNGEAIWLTQSMLRIILGDRVLTWDYEELQKVKQQRMEEIMNMSEQKLARRMTEYLNVFDLETMGKVTPLQALKMDGGWEVTKTEAKWTVLLYWSQWHLEDTLMLWKVEPGRRFVQILEGQREVDAVQRVVEINLPEGVIDARFISTESTPQYIEIQIECQRANPVVESREFGRVPRRGS